LAIDFSEIGYETTGLGRSWTVVSDIFIRINEFSMARFSSGLDKVFNRLATGSGGGFGRLNFSMDLD
jgi:hypothetical protein